MSAAPEISSITIREINEPAEMHAVEELQKEIWGVPDLDVVPLTHLVAAKEAGGVLIGAFDDETCVGFVYGFPSFERGQVAHHSHMLAVKPAYRNYDLGRRLKLAQREHVIAQGMKLISWTFDPLQSLNAHFNFGKLGVLADRYLVNFYGEDATSFLHQTGTDRLWVSWLVSSERVQGLIDGGSRQISSHHGPPLVQLETDDSPRRNDLAEGLSRDQAAIEIPSNIDALPREMGLRWREDTRWAFTEALKAGYIVDAFVRETRGDKRIGKYILSHKKAQKAQKDFE
ncbi:MAG TPA: GNAT family N-acetyltransferase [Pyrinomonadaceae bacterium]|nr:GNAT family N-acetyltransferase [Pyrinomonadaceae bacterium]